MEWHDASCSRLDMVTCGGVQSCLRCGSFIESATLAPLPAIKKQFDIRLLRLFPGHPDEDIQGEIFVQDLISLPEYDAISYTWADETGNADLCKTISIFGESLQVTRNCENALKRIRLPYDRRTIWIDAVCINQNDPNERGHQVQLMPQIYSRAEQVLVYIGEAADKSDLCMDVLSQGHVSYQDANDFIIAANRLLERPYFSRVWVLQEIALARKARLICGERQILWTRLSKCEIAPAGILKLAFTPVIKLNDAEIFTTPERLLDLLDLSRECDAKDARDKVYAILGLAIDEKSRGLVADYNISVVDLYTEVALRLASRHGWVKVLCRAGVQFRRIQPLPSWVPDWTSPISGNGTQSRSIDLGLHVPPEVVQYDPRDRSLCLTVGRAGRLDEGQVYLLTTHFANAQMSTTSPELPPCLCFPDDRYSFMGIVPRVSAKLPFNFILLKLDEYRPLDTQTLCGHLKSAQSVQGPTLVNAQEASVSLTITTARRVYSSLFSIYEIVKDRMGGPWIELMRHTSNEKHIPGGLYWNDVLTKAIMFEPPAVTEVGKLWRHNITLDPGRDTKLRGRGNDYALLLALNDGIWRLMVRLFLWKEVKLKIT
ncbi:HET-domain-containing protein [Xylariaceae sp. AK1471]|nr:HET-domain-containing protein [Xylariaceae sp. AK1471]